MTSLEVHKTLDDRRLVEDAARAIGVPRAEVIGDRFSFVLHAPLELLARAELLPFVSPEHRDRARARISALADGYERSGPPRPPAAAVVFDSAEQAVAILAAAVAAGDRPGADAAATWLGQRCRADQLAVMLADLVLPSLEAAGHGNIHLALLARTQPRGLPGQMLRHPVDALVAERPRAITLPPTRLSDDPTTVPRLLGAIAATRPVDPPDSAFIAPLVEHALRHGVLDRFLDDDGTFVSPRRPPFELLRFAAQAMLQGPSVQAPYGWTHCLTLAQAPLLLAAAGADVSHATAVAVTYLAAHWAGHGDGAVELDHVPEPVGADLHEALHTGPEAAAGVAWHADDPAEVAGVLATMASVNHDAHRVKYTLACLDAVACDPAASRLYLAAAAHLNAWWELQGDASDPSPSG